MPCTEQAPSAVSFASVTLLLVCHLEGWRITETPCSCLCGTQPSVGSIWVSPLDSLEPSRPSLELPLLFPTLDASHTEAPTGFCLTQTPSFHYSLPLYRLAYLEQFT